MRHSLRCPKCRSCKYKKQKCTYRYKVIDLKGYSWKDSPLIHNSHGEGWIQYFLKTNNIPYQSPKSFRGISPLRYDFWIKNTKILIEYDGEQHRKPVKHFGGDARYYDQVQHDCKKSIWAKQHGYMLYRIKTKSPRKVQQILYSIFNYA